MENQCTTKHPTSTTTAKKLPCRRETGTLKPQECQSFSDPFCFCRETRWTGWPSASPPTASSARQIVKSERGPYSFGDDAAFNKRRGGGVESQDQAKAHLPDDGVIVVVDFPKVLRVALLLYVVNSTLDVEVKPSLGMEFPFTSGRATVCSSPSLLGASQADKLELSEHMQRRC